MSELATTTVNNRLLLEGAGFSSIPTDWEIIELGSVLERVSVGVMYPGESTFGGVPLFRAGDLTSNEVIAPPEFKIAHSVHAEYIRTSLKKDDLLVSL